MNHIKWPSIEAFHNVRKAIKKYPHISNGKFNVTYRGKVKLHGSNFCIQIAAKDSKMLVQSRKKVITPEMDNAGSAAWAYEAKESWKAIDWNKVRAFSPKVSTVCFFGEWSGKGIQAGTAVNEIGKKILALFSVMLILEDEEPPIFLTDPADISTVLPNVPDTYVLPFYGEAIVVDYYKSAEELQETVDIFNKAVEGVEACDPWVKETFGVEGVGEGIVYYPVSKEHLGKESFSNLAFKAKGEKHKAVKQKKSVQADSEVVTSVSEFVELVVTEARLEQGVVDGCDSEYETKKIGMFLGWVGKDVKKECQSELEASSLEWKQVHKSITSKARMWYMHKIETT